MALLTQWLERRASRKEKTQLQLDALWELADRAVKTLERIDRRARENDIRRDDIRWLEDDSAMDVAALDRIDFMDLNNRQAMPLVAKLQRAARTAQRRLGFAATAVKKGKTPIPDHFKDPLSHAKEVRSAFAALGGGPSPQKKS